MTVARTASRPAVGDAINAVEHVYFTHAPAFEDKLAVEAERLIAERADLEARRGALAGREEDHRAAWRTIASAIPGQTTDIPFDGILPQRCPTEPHAGIVGYVPADSWPSWFFDCVRAAENANRCEEEAA